MFLYIYSIWALNRGLYPCKMNVFVCRGQIFEAEGEIKFSPVYRHILVLLRLANIEQITSFELTVQNQDDEFIPRFSDCILLLQFIRHSTKEDKHIQF